MGILISELSPHLQAQVEAQIGKPKRKASTKRKNAAPEYELQCQLIAWCKSHPALSWAYGTFNGVRVGIGLAVKMKRMGNTKGVSDLVAPYAKRGYHGLYMELKAPGELSDLSKEQREFGLHCEAEGYLWCACCDIDAGINVLSWYIGFSESKPSAGRNALKYVDWGCSVPED